MTDGGTPTDPASSRLIWEVDIAGIANYPSVLAKQATSDMDAQPAFRLRPPLDVPAVEVTGGTRLGE
jgi:hypothetical protein